MRKEGIVAVVVGIILGLIITYGVFRINNSFKSSTEKKAAVSPTPESPNNLKLALAKPNNDEVVTDSVVEISGITSPGAWVVIATSSRDYVIQSDENGTFSYKVNLSSGINELLIASIDKNFQVETKNLRVVSSLEMAKEPKDFSTPSPASGEAEIQAEVEKKVTQTLNSPQAFLGTVTDIAEGTFQIKSDSGEIKLISAPEKEIVVVKTEKDKEIKASDIAIGDYIVALGYTNGNHVLNAKRILVTASQAPLPVKITAGKVVSINKKEITVGDTTILISADTRYTSTKDKETVNIKPAFLEENYPVIITSLSKEAKTIARRIHLLP